MSKKLFTKKVNDIKRTHKEMLNDMRINMENID